MTDISMLGTLVTATTTLSGNSVSATHTLSAGSNRIAIAFVSQWKATTPVTIGGCTYGGVTMTHVTTAAYYAGTSGYSRVEVFYLLEASLPANGSKTVTATFNGSEVSTRHIAVFTIQDAKQIANEAEAKYEGTSKTASASVTTTDGAWVFTGACNTQGTSYAVGSGQTEIWDDTIQGGSYEQVTAGSNTQTEIATFGSPTLLAHTMMVVSFAKITENNSFFMWF
jgi:hypothetical protein